MSGYLIPIVPVGIVCGFNYFLGYRWSKLDHNPWAGQFLHGMLAGPTPSAFPGKLSVEQIRYRGRRMMTMAPIMFGVVTFFALLTALTR